jgi:hypothetical protein
MTDVKNSGPRRHLRGLPLDLKKDVFQLIAAGQDDLQHRGGKRKGQPNLARIARAAGVNKQRLSDIETGTTPVSRIYTMGALVRCYEQIHGVTEQEALAALLCVGEAPCSNEALAA